MAKAKDFKFCTLVARMKYGRQTISQMGTTDFKFHGRNHN